ncbi:hypothetical protein ANHYDRO_02117 [Anaerococcus hydrogenalis DSM 7454]|uniref:Uncharacterized protein n=1 Tax=Anaerococcus hydrogenalis DSM 7454 TaxID=561177 RepID=B6WBY1_9FIRM|nr:hypothetical protein ANHYDRO_02117 [Anaerococcus hydrogenalis DSM 7454]
MHNHFQLQQAYQILLKTLRALLEASNSTGRVIIWKIKTKRNKNIPIVINFPIERKSPINHRKG